MRGFLLVATLLGTVVRASAITPTAITFTVSHADCDGAGSHAFAFYLNGALLGTAASSQGCDCNREPLVVTFADPASLAHFGPASCNSFRVDTSGGGANVLLGFVRVAVATAGAPAETCLFDGWATNAQGHCVDRDLCDAPWFDSGIGSAGGPDQDGDGVVAGIGVGCDDCPATANPAQTDGDGDRVGDECDDCPAAADPAQADSDGDGLGDVCDPCPHGFDGDGDGICDDVDDCPDSYDPAQADGDGDGFGDACDGCVGSGTVDTDGDGTCDAVDDCPLVPDPAQVDADGDGIGDVCDDCSLFDPGQEDSNGDGIADACSPGISIAAVAPVGGAIHADVQVTSPLGRPLAGMIQVLDGSGVGGLTYTWLATSCAVAQDALDLIVNGVSAARVVPEPGGPFCCCMPAVSSFSIPLGRAVALLHPGVNQLGIRKATAVPNDSATGIAWAYASLTVGGSVQRINLLDVMGGNDYDNPDLCGAGYTFDAVDAVADTTALPPPALSLPWTAALPCGVDLSPLVPDHSYMLAVSATDGVVGAPTGDARGFDRAAEAVLMFNGDGCDDGNPCTIDSCAPSGCVHSPIVCPAGDQCHDAGVCDPATGQCSQPAKSDGTACSDGNACTQSDACRAGTCTGANPVVCGGADQCHDAGVCDPATGQCSQPVKPDGTSCNDGNPCTQSDACRAGSCTGANPVICAAADQCHDAGVCDPTTGRCSMPAKSDGAVCNDGNACTRTDACRAGVCTGADPVVCGGGDSCRDGGTCDPGTGACMGGRTKPDGAACDDGNACTRTDVCRQGQCVGKEPLFCPPPDRCHVAFCRPHKGCHAKRIAPQRVCSGRPASKGKERSR